MSCSNHALKVNNSYESEPSSGSGSSLSETNDLGQIEDGPISLPYLLLPPVCENSSPAFGNIRHGQNLSTPQRERSLASSQESPFTGFGDSPFGKLQRQFFEQSQRKRVLNSSPGSTATNDSVASSGRARLTADGSFISPEGASLASLSSQPQLLYNIPVHSSQESCFEGFSGSPFGKLKNLMYPPKLSHSEGYEGGRWGWRGGRMEVKKARTGHGDKAETKSQEEIKMKENRVYPAQTLTAKRIESESEETETSSDEEDTPEEVKIVYQEGKIRADTAEKMSKEKYTKTEERSVYSGQKSELQCIEINESDTETSSEEEEEESDKERIYPEHKGTFKRSVENQLKATDTNSEMESKLLERDQEETETSSDEEEINPRTRAIHLKTGERRVYLGPRSKPDFVETDEEETTEDDLLPEVDNVYPDDKVKLELSEPAEGVYSKAKVKRNYPVARLKLKPLETDVESTEICAEEKKTKLGVDAAYPEQKMIVKLSEAVQKQLEISTKIRLSNVEIVRVRPNPKPETDEEEMETESSSEEDERQTEVKSVYPGQRERVALPESEEEDSESSSEEEESDSDDEECTQIQSEILQKDLKIVKSKSEKSTETSQPAMEAQELKSLPILKATPAPEVVIVNDIRTPPTDSQKKDNKTRESSTEDDNFSGRPSKKGFYDAVHEVCQEMEEGKAAFTPKVSMPYLETSPDVDSHDGHLVESQDASREDPKAGILPRVSKVGATASREGAPVPGKGAFPRFLEDNSCNAVDLLLTSESSEQASSSGGGSHGVSGGETFPPSTLSFNGRIQKLTPHEEVAPSDEKCALSESFVLKKYSNERSPDLFDDDDDEAEEEEKTSPARRRPSYETHSHLAEESGTASLEPLATRADHCMEENQGAPQESATPLCEQWSEMTAQQRGGLEENCRREKSLLRRIQKCLAGVPPPPSVTHPSIDLLNIVVAQKAQILDYLKAPTLASSQSSESSLGLFRPTHSLGAAQTLPWRDILGVRQHGLCFNWTNASERSEYLGLSVVKRLVGAETNSSYRVSPTSAKKRIARMKMLAQSPGSRLSHLARRRAIFSSANLASTSLKTTAALGPQIIIDKRRRHRRKATPKRKTPSSKRKHRRTPSSSARKKLPLRCNIPKVPAPSRESSKRALFQSPAKQQQQPVAPKPLFKPDVATRVEKSKRALFSPEPNASSSGPTTQLDVLLRRKRRRSHDAGGDDDAEDSCTAQCRKVFRTAAPESLTPRALKIKSQSFCLGAGSHATSVDGVGPPLPSLGRALSSAENLFANGPKTLQRAQSDMIAPSSSLTDNQRKKLLWAVSQALQEKKITVKHENFKPFAGVLARVVRRIFQEFYQRTSTSNSETLLKLCKKYAFYVISGRTSDEVYLQAKAHIEEKKRLSSMRLTGYIGPEEYQQMKALQQENQKQSALSQRSSTSSVCLPENSMESFNLTASQSSVSVSQTSLAPAERATIEPNPAQQRSSSKSNFGGLALRENVDGELRRSAQKNFTGKDQRNMSPYAAFGGLSGSGRKAQTSATKADLCGKAKRQISFDS